MAQISLEEAKQQYQGQAGGGQIGLEQAVAQFRGAPPEEEKKGFFKQAGEAIVRPFLRAGASIQDIGRIAGGEKDASKLLKPRTFSVPGLGDVGGITPLGASPQGRLLRGKEQAKDIVGAGLEIGSTILPPLKSFRFGGQLFKGLFGQALKTGITTGAVAGGLGLGGLALQEQKPAGEVAKDTALGIAGGGVVGGALPVGGLGAKAALTTAKGILGVTTGVGSKTLSRFYQTIAKGTKEEFKQATNALRTNAVETLMTVHEKVLTGLNSLRHKRGVEYRANLAALPSAGKRIGFADIKTKLSNLMTDFGIRIDKKGVLDFSRSTIADEADAGKVAKIIDEVRRWGTEKGDGTVLGIDILRKRLDDFYSSTSGEANKFVTSLRDLTVDKLNKATQGKYSEMTKAYRIALATEKDIMKSFSLGTNSGYETALKKLTQVVKDENNFKELLIQRIEKEIGEPLTGELAGAALSSYVPTGLFGRLSGVGITGTAIGTLNPGMLPALAATSPRIVGEFLRGLGLGKRATLKVSEQLRKLSPKRIFGK